MEQTIESKLSVMKVVPVIAIKDGGKAQPLAKVTGKPLVNW
ncbi:hypothetical protein ACQKPX_00940 [Photobacterium sp. DNB23_23_1]